MRTLNQIFVLLFFSFLNCYAFAQTDTVMDASVVYNDAETPHRAKISGVFADTSLLRLEISGQLKSLLHDTGEKRIYHPLTVRYILNKDTVEIDCLARTSGKTRRDHAICNFPPVTIRFSNFEHPDNIFVPGNRYKIFTHCQNSVKSYEQYIILEYLIYKIYQVLTPYSFRVRLLLIKWRDTEKPAQNLERYALLVESPQELAERLQITEKINFNMTDDSIDHFQSTLLAFFQYMIGNTDWSVKALHNIRLFSVHGINLVPVPYDFDYCGLINAPYAVPAPELKIPSVRERYYNGYCRTVEELQSVIAHFNRHKDEIIQIIAENPYLTDRFKKNSLAYLNDFYKIINKPRSVKYIFTTNCRND